MTSTIPQKQRLAILDAVQKVVAVERRRIAALDGHGQKDAKELVTKLDKLKEETHKLLEQHPNQVDEPLIIYNGRSFHPAKFEKQLNSNSPLFPFAKDVFTSLKAIRTYTSTSRALNAAARKLLFATLAEMRATDPFCFDAEHALLKPESAAYDLLAGFARSRARYLYHDAVRQWSEGNDAKSQETFTRAIEYMEIVRELETSAVKDPKGVFEPSEFTPPKPDANRTKFFIGAEPIDHTLIDKVEVVTVAKREQIAKNVTEKLLLKLKHFQNRQNRKL